MISQSMKDIDPDKLFEEKSISEIENVQKKIQEEVERKKEELRTMVGERYRDLIEAADTISSMQITAEKVIERVNVMEQMCGTFQQRQLLGFQLDLSRPSQSVVDRQDSRVSLAVQMKILVATPEQIWIAMEREDLLLGAQFFILARHIKTGLLLEKLDSMMPIVIHQWTAISHFQSKLVARARHTLALADIASQTAAKCLCVLALLDCVNGEELLRNFLEVREKAVHCALSQGDDNTSVKKRISSSLSLLLRSMSLLHSCFVEGRAGLSEGLVWQQLQAFSQSGTQSIDLPTATSLSTVDLLDLLGIEPVSIRCLPPVVRDYRPTSIPCKEGVPLPRVRELTSHWLQTLYVYLKDALGSLLGLVTSIRSLQRIRDTAVKQQQEAESHGWDTALHKLQLPCGLDLWAAYYQPLLSNRVRDLVENQWKSTLTMLRQKIADELRSVLRDKTYQPEHDLRWFVWRERSSDLPQQTSSGGLYTQNHGLFLKCRGYSPRVEALCQALDAPLNSLLQELSTYARDADFDREHLQNHLQQCSSAHLKELCSFVEDECLIGVTGREEASVTLVARLLGALCDLCPSLQACFLPLISVSSSKTMKVSTAWTDMVSILQVSSKQAWTIWQELVSSNLKTALEEKLLPQSGNLGTLLLHSTPQWEERSMEETGEGGDKLKSVIRTPAQPSIPLQQVLVEASQVLGAAQPHTIPSGVRTALVEQLVTDILVKYRSVVTPELAQPLALQFLLDVKFLSSLIIPRTHKSLSTQAQDLCKVLEERIDPFDLDIFSPYLQNSVRQSVRHMQCLLGVLISCWPEKLANMWSSSSDKSAGSAIEQPSMLAMCPPAPWFPLLPVVSPNSATSVTPPAASQGKPQLKKSTGSRSPKRRTNVKESKSGAASFFGAMSSDWFS